MLVRSFGDFNTLRTVHPGFQEHSRATLFQSIDWFEHLARHGMPADIVPCLLSIASSAAAPVDRTLVLPLLRQGRGLVSLSNYYSGLYGPIGDGNGSATWLVVCDYLRASRPAPGYIKLQPLDANSAFFGEMRGALDAAGYWTDSYFCFGNWYLPTARSSFDGYLSERPSALRNTLRRGRKKLDRAGNWQIVVHSEPGPRLDTAISDYETIYARSWKPAEAHPGFIRELCQLAARRGWLRLGVLSIEGKAVASQIWLFSAGKACIFKLAYDPAAARYSAGTVLTAAMIEYAIERDAAEEIDYLSGDDAYKQDWMSHRRERIGLVAFDPATLQGLWAGLRHFGGRSVTALLRRMRG